MKISVCNGSMPCCNRSKSALNARRSDMVKLDLKWYYYSAVYSRRKHTHNSPLELHTITHNLAQLVPHQVVAEERLVLGERLLTLHVADCPLSDARDIVAVVSEEAENGAEMV